MDVAHSVNKVPIRLTEERWAHIIENKPYTRAYYEEVLAAVEKPTWVARGYAGALVAILSLGSRKFLNVVYREINRHGRFYYYGFYLAKRSQR